ncbi:hypothetical protein LCGC14_0825930 [marine sediment metagenome]|uniref:Uncharacterized protein n=1 Tax=marine sediment metagenome TaxID=412755 RepID=A0A0F9PM42_9ZZZZ
MWWEDGLDSQLPYDQGHRRYYPHSMRVCPRCNTNPVRAQNRPYCPECQRVYDRGRWPLRDKTRIRVTRRDWQRRVRLEAISHYGGRCACCGESEEAFLALDHINGGGNRHRRENKIGLLSYWVRKEGYPDGFQVLCHNCNQAKTQRGACPHLTPAGDGTTPTR